MIAKNNINDNMEKRTRLDLLTALIQQMPEGEKVWAAFEQQLLPHLKQCAYAREQISDAEYQLELQRMLPEIPHFVEYLRTRTFRFPAK